MTFIKKYIDILKNNRGILYKRCTIYCCCLLFVFVSIVLSGCGSKYDEQAEVVSGEHYTLKKVPLDSNELASENDVNRIVEKHVMGENVELVEKWNDIGGELYQYVSTDRELSFTVYNTLRGYGGMPNGGVSKLIQTINVNYSEGIMNFYSNDIRNVLENSSYRFEPRKNNFDYNIYYKDFSELKDISNIVIKINDIYKQELIYNSKEWLEKYPVCRIYIRFIDPNTNDDYPTAYVDITGDWDENRLYTYLSSEHCKDNANGLIVDSTIPDEYLDDTHRSVLYNIYIEDINISDTAFYKRYTHSGAKRIHGASENAFYSSVYYEPWDTYLILLDVGPIYAGNKWELITGVYLEELADSYDYYRGDKNSEFNWTIGDDKWKIVTEICKEKNDAFPSNHYCFDFSLLKNDVNQEIPYVKKCDGIGIDLETVGIPVGEFAKMFNLTYEIDEKSDDGYIYFRRNR